MEATVELPPVRGVLTQGRPMAELTWLRVGGPADWLFQPADEDDLAGFLAALPAEVPVLPVGVGSNLIVRDGGIAGVVIRLGRGFNAIGIERRPGDRRRRRARRARRAQGGGGGDRPHLPAHHPRLDRRRGADERRLLRQLHRRRLRRGAGGHPDRASGSRSAPPTWASPTARRRCPKDSSSPR